MSLIVAIFATLITFILMKLHVLKYSTKVLLYVAVFCLILVPVFLTIPMNYFSPGGELRLVRNTVQVVPQVSGQITEVYVESGDKVEAGQPLFSIDPGPYEDQVRILSSSLADAETRAQVLLEQVKNAEAGVELARQQLTLAEAQYSSAPLQALQSAEANLQKEKANQLLAQKELERQQDLFSKKLISPQEYDRYRERTVAADSGYQVAANQLEQAHINVSSGNQQISSARQQLLQAESVLNQAKLNSQSAYDGENTLIAQTRAQLKTAQRNLEWTTVTASIDGTVLNVQLRPGIEVGNSPVIVLQDDASAVLGVFIKQSNMRHIKIGDSAEMFFDKYPGEHFTAKVRDIGRAVQEGQVTAGATLVSSADINKRSPFVIELDPDDPTLLQRLPTGAGGFGAIFTDYYKPTRIPRKLLTRMDSWWKLVMP